MGYNKPETRTATIASGATTSDAIDLGDYTLAALHLPAAFTGTAITVTTAPTLTGTYQALYADASAVSLAVAASRTVAPVGDEADAIASVRFIKLVSGSAELAARTITLTLKKR